MVQIHKYTYIRIHKLPIELSISTGGVQCPTGFVFVWHLSGNAFSQFSTYSSIWLMCYLFTRDQMIWLPYSYQSYCCPIEPIRGYLWASHKIFPFQLFAENMCHLVTHVLALKFHIFRHFLSSHVSPAAAGHCPRNDTMLFKFKFSLVPDMQRFQKVELFNGIRLTKFLLYSSSNEY